MINKKELVFRKDSKWNVIPYSKEKIASLQKEKLKQIFLHNLSSDEIEEIEKILLEEYEIMWRGKDFLVLRQKST
jgi:hypothetical protein